MERREHTGSERRAAAELLARPAPEVSVPLGIGPPGMTYMPDPEHERRDRGIAIVGGSGLVTPGLAALGVGVDSPDLSAAPEAPATADQTGGRCTFPGGRCVYDECAAAGRCLARPAPSSTSDGAPPVAGEPR